jgi:hypothetical protein
MIGPCCIFSAGMMNFIDPAKKKRSAASVWAVQSRRLRLLGLDFDIVGSPIVFERLPVPEELEVAAASTSASNDSGRNRHS